MKGMKRILALFLTAAMITTSAGVAWAEDPAAAADGGPAVSAGEGTTPTEGEGTTPTEGEGTTPTEGEGTTPTEGEGTTPTEGEGTTPTEGEGTTPTEGEGTTPTEGEGTTPPEGEEGKEGDGTETTPLVPNGVEEPQQPAVSTLADGMISDAEDLAAAFAAGGEYTLNESVTCSSILTLAGGKSLDLDLGGNTLTLTGYASISGAAGASATIQNGTIISDGTASCISFGNSGFGTSAGSLELKNCTIRYSGTNSYVYALQFCGESLTIEDSTITQTVSYPAVCISLPDPTDTAVIRGDTTIENTADTNRFAIRFDQVFYASSQGILEIGEAGDSDSVTVDGIVQNFNTSAAFRINSGRFEYSGSDLFGGAGAFEVNGGLYKVDISGKTGGNPCVPSGNSDYPYTVVQAEEGAVAYTQTASGYQYYSTLQEALAAGQGTVYLFGEVSASAEELAALSGTVAGTGAGVLKLTASLTEVLPSMAGLNIEGLTIEDSQNQSIADAVLTGGRIAGGSVSSNAWKACESFLADGFLFYGTDISTGKETVAVRDESTYEARIGKIGYGGVNSAIAYAEPGAEIVLLHDSTAEVEITSPDQSFTLDLNGHAITVDSGKVPFSVLEGGNNANIVIRNGSLTGGDMGVHTNGNAQNVTLKLENVTISNEGIGAYLAAVGSYEINGGSITGHTGLSLRRGTVVLDGDVAVTGTGERYVPEDPSAGGIYSTGDAVYIDGSYPGDLDLTIQNGTYTSTNAAAIRMLFSEDSGDTETITVHGGKFSMGDDEQLEGYLAENLYLGAETGYWVVTEKSAVGALNAVPAEPESTVNAGNVAVPTVPDGVTAPTEAETETAANGIVSEVQKNAAVSDYVPTGLADAAEGKVVPEAGEIIPVRLSITLEGLTLDAVVDGQTVTLVPASLSFDVTPEKQEENTWTKIESLNGQSVTFRLPIPSTVTQRYAKVTHSGDADRYLEILTDPDTDAKYIELSSTHFSPFIVTFTNSLPTVSNNSSSGSSFTERQNEFWDEVKELLRKAEPGDTVTVNARSYDRMPYSVMKVLGEQDNVTLYIRWNGGEDIAIPSAFAVNEAQRVYYPLSYLEGMDFGVDQSAGTADKVNPATGGIAWWLEAPVSDDLGENGPVTDARLGLSTDPNGIEASADLQTANYEAEAEEETAGGISPMVLILAGAVLLAAAGAGYWYWKRRELQ